MALSAEVSIHAPAWGATGRAGLDAAWLRRFNPRTRVGCDQQGKEDRATVPGFNPRTRVGCDFCFLRIQTTYMLVSIHAPAWGATCNGRGFS